MRLPTPGRGCRRARRRCGDPLVSCGFPAVRAPGRLARGPPPARVQVVEGVWHHDVLAPCRGRRSPPSAVRRSEPPSGATDRHREGGAASSGFPGAGRRSAAAPPGSRGRRPVARAGSWASTPVSRRSDGWPPRGSPRSGPARAPGRTRPVWCATWMLPGPKTTERAPSAVICGASVPKVTVVEAPAGLLLEEPHHLGARRRVDAAVGAQHAHPDLAARLLASEQEHQLLHRCWTRHPPTARESVATRG